VCPSEASASHPLLGPYPENTPSTSFEQRLDLEQGGKDQTEEREETLVEEHIPTSTTLYSSS
jgi:hypothetical protein